MCIFAVVMKNNAMKKEKDGALINSVESEQSRPIPFEIEKGRISTRTLSCFYLLTFLASIYCVGFDKNSTNLRFDAKKTLKILAI